MLKAAPDWVSAARAFVAGLEAQTTPDGRVEFIEACRSELGEPLYPGFIKLLAAVSAFGDAEVRRLAADALAHALATGRLPAARLPAWGSASLPGAPPGFPAGALSTHLRRVGPVEYLCVWRSRAIGEERLDEEAFRVALGWVLTLFDASPRAAELYRARLIMDADNPMEGLHSADSRRMVRALVGAWEAGAPARDIATCAEAADAAGSARDADPLANLFR